MEPDEINTPAEAGTEPVETTESDNADSWDYFDPEEDTEAAPEPEATDEAVEVEEVEPEQPAPALVKLADGTELPLEEVSKGYMRQADYTRKTQEVAQTQAALVADLQRIESITQAFVDHLAGMVPAQPDPSLALRDPNAYVRQKAQYDAAMAQVQKLIEIGQAPKEIKGALDQRDMQAKAQAEMAKLTAQFPTVATEEGKKKFYAAAAEAAQAAGITIDELKQVSDHRLFVLAHWAKVGMEADKARKVAKEKVANVPPSMPRKAGQPAGGARDVDAVKKFNANPTVRNAAKLNF